MKRILLALMAVVAISCPGGLHTNDCGEIRFECRNNNQGMFICNADGKWELHRSCAAVGEVCVVGPANCGGYPGPCCR